MGEFTFDIPVRRGQPINSNSKIGGLTEVVKAAAFSTAVGILLYGLSKKKFTKASSMTGRMNALTGEDALTESIHSVGQKMKNFFEGLF
jgi:cell division ATPase FtsA